MSIERSADRIPTFAELNLIKETREERRRKRDQLIKLLSQQKEEIHLDLLRHQNTTAQREPSKIGELKQMLGQVSKLLKAVKENNYTLLKTLAADGETVRSQVVETHNFDAFVH